ncbi:hypothetical protein ETH_00019320 [Eimeria tenella]|uniref:Uncharacterized protein n=1 Tax=Eimeria tenella TaxID=5802 RepID=U6KU52_EIMTE|nr:hypothetical protein ETH_00019320 [Eimeria tenella]CDJ40428.1 hypothetical protein ETH_00019320 [Eimeria tenella]|eukprot:XP_013231178.1 hypothetical protein ETH_00019320 [Eimeria tenella]
MPAAIPPLPLAAVATTAAAAAAAAAPSTAAAASPSTRLPQKQQKQQQQQQQQLTIFSFLNESNVAGRHVLRAAPDTKGKAAKSSNKTKVAAAEKPLIRAVESCCYKYELLRLLLLLLRAELYLPRKLACSLLQLPLQLRRCGAVGCPAAAAAAVVPAAAARQQQEPSLLLRGRFASCCSASHTGAAAATAAAAIEQTARFVSKLGRI